MDKIKLKIVGEDINTNNWQFFINDEKIDNMVAISFELNANKDPVANISFYLEHLNLEINNFEYTEYKLKSLPKKYLKRRKTKWGMIWSLMTENKKWKK